MDSGLRLFLDSDPDSGSSSPSSPDPGVETSDSGFPPAENPDSAAETQARPSRQVSEFTDDYGVFSGYLEPMGFEYDTDFDYRDYGDAEDEVDVNNVADPREALIQHTKQVRESFGFDVDVVVPSWANVSYYPVPLSDPARLEEMREPAEVAIAEINADLNGKCYELVEILKAVLTPTWMHHLTLSAKKLDDNSLVTIQAMVMDNHPNGGVELEQWRFKP